MKQIENDYFSIKTEQKFNLLDDPFEENTLSPPYLTLYTHSPAGRRWFEF